LLLALLLLLATGAFGVFATFRYRHAGDNDVATIAVLPFDVIGNSQLEYLRTGIVEMVSRNIDGAAHLHAVGSEISIQAARNNKPPEQIAKQLSARYIVSGNVASTGNQLRITATVQDFRGVAKQVTREVSGTPDHLFDVVDELSAQILASTRSGEDAHLSESAALTTKSLPALRSYLEGEDHYRNTEYDSAVAHFSKAIALDSTFALAYYRLAIVQVSRGRAVPAREPLEHATQYSGRLSERDQKLVHSFALAFDGKWRESELELRALLESHPEDLEVMYNLGSLLEKSNQRHGKSYKEPVELLDKVLAEDARFFCPI
jgi:TolB-like protein